MICHSKILQVQEFENKRIANVVVGGYFVVGF